MPTPLLLLIAVVAGWLVQLYLSYQQSMSFNDQVRALRRSGRVSVGAGGRRYRGGRAFVALAFDEHDVVRDAIQLSGWTTFARSRPFPGVVGLTAAQLRRDREIPGVGQQQREAARQAAELLRQKDASAAVPEEPVRH